MSSPQPTALTLTTHGEAATEALGARIGAACQGGEVIALEGPLGAGKTCLVRGLAAGLGIAGPTPSPTFILLRSYRGTRGLTLHHLDCYRLAGDDELETVGYDDCPAPDAVIAAEWASRCPEAFGSPDLLVRLEATADNAEARRILLTGNPALLTRIQA